MSQRQNNPVAACAGATDDDVVDNPGNQYGEVKLVIVMKRNSIIAFK